MAKQEYFLAIDIGATSIKVCEFVTGPDIEGLVMTRASYREYEEELSENTREGVISGLLRQMLMEDGFKGKKALLCLSGQLSLMRFTRLPPGEYNARQLQKLAAFEAIQNIPFPVDQIVNDYQFLVSPDDGAMDSMSIVVKNDIVEQLMQAVASVGCAPILIDVAPAACYNAARANGLGEDGCDMVLDIGGRVTNVMFLDGERFFSRTIPVAGYSVTQQIAREFGIGFSEAEELKRQHGFVALGGAYEEPESETAANVSKIIRNTMTRLYGEVQRTISAFVASQHGSRPKRLFLAGGTSICTYMDLFFSEKMDIPVEYLNPYQCVTFEASVNKENLEPVSHLFADCIGLGLRYVSPCPLELSLVPRTVRRQQDFDKRKLMFCVSMLLLVMMFACMWGGLDKRIKTYMDYSKKLDQIYKQSQAPLNELKSANGKTDEGLKAFADLRKLMLKQTEWPAILDEFYRLKPNFLWLTEITPIYDTINPINAESQKVNQRNDMAADAPMFPEGDPMAQENNQAASNAQGKEKKVVGFMISGCSVRPYQDSDSWILGEEIKFPFEVKKEGEKLTITRDGKEVTLTRNQLIEEAMKKAAKTPESIYEAALQNSLLFSADKKMTGLAYYHQPSSKVGNYSVFKIQVKLNEPLVFQDFTGGVGLTGSTR